MLNRLVILSLFGITLFSCSEEKELNNNKIQVVCTTGMIGDAAKNILGTKFSITTLMGPGVDPHLYKATPNDLKSLRSADIIIVNGLHLEGKMQDIFKKLKRNKLVITLSDGLDESRLRKGDQMSYDPHIWFNVGLWSDAMSYMSSKLQQEYPSKTNNIKLRSFKYVQKLNILDSTLRINAKSIPEQKRVLITAHDAFGYFGDAYGFKVLALKGMSTVSDANLKHINELTQLIVKNDIQAIFPESSLPEGNILGVIEACHKLGHKVKIGKTLFSDAMGKDGTPEGTYLGMVEYNMNTIIEGLK